jgi:hypothetical protein
MVGHHGIGTDVDGENRGQQASAVFNPLSAVLVVLAIMIKAAQKSSADTARNNMVVRGIGNGDEFFSGLSHGKFLLRMNARDANAGAGVMSIVGCVSFFCFFCFLGVCPFFVFVLCELLGVCPCLFLFVDACPRRCLSSKIENCVSRKLCPRKF